MGAAMSGIMWGIQQNNSSTARYREMVRIYRQVEAAGKSLNLSEYQMYVEAGTADFKEALNVYWTTFAEEMVPWPLDIPTKPEDSIGVALEAGSVYYKGKAWSYAAGKTLIYPNKSGIFRAYMSKSKMFGKLSGYATVAQLFWAEYTALQAEWDYIHGR